MEVRLPGLVDLQVNGVLGIDFSSPELTRESFKVACRALVARGTAHFLPTVITATEDILERNLRLMAACRQDPEIKNAILGFHLEGPFISPTDGYRGAHPKEAVRAPSVSLFDKMMEWSVGGMRLMTVAAETEGVAELIRHGRRRGVKISIGHSSFDKDQLNRAAEAGADGLTHLGNGIPGTLPRHPNPIWDGLGHDSFTAMFITDGHHLPPAVVKTMARAKGEKWFAVSDASPIAGMAPGKYRTLGNDVILEAGGRLYNPQTGYLVGSSFTQLECANALLAWGFALPEVMAACLERPLAYLGLAANNPGDSNCLLCENNQLTVRPV
jgi:N-acetylglucosamine-6-phosphate deacetylase